MWSWCFRFLLARLGLVERRETYRTNKTPTANSAWLAGLKRTKKTPTANYDCLADLALAPVTC